MIKAPAEAERKEDVSLSELIPADDWAEYSVVIEQARAAGLGFAIGGGLALSTYSGRWRNTKDVDLFILPDSRWEWIDTIARIGFADYYDHEAYDRTWIYRGTRNGVILDLIWTMPNHRMEVDETWLTRGCEVEIHGQRVRLVPPEEYVWSKLYVLQRDRCDWPDILNVLRGYGCQMDWRRLVERAGEDLPVLAGVVSVYSWLCPREAHALPCWVWPELGLRPPAHAPSCDGTQQRTFLLDTRDWFGPTVGENGLCS